MFLLYGHSIQTSYVCNSKTFQRRWRPARCSNRAQVIVFLFPGAEIEGHQRIVCRYIECPFIGRQGAVCRRTACQNPRYSFAIRREHPDAARTRRKDCAVRMHRQPVGQALLALFTDQVISILSSSTKHLAFVLWGSYAQKKGSVISTNNHFILKSPHPSPLSAHRGFFGSRPFSKVNAYLTENGKSAINW